MRIHHVEPVRETLRGTFSKDFPPVLTFESGDTVRFRTPDVSWGLEPFSASGTRKVFPDRDPVTDAGHAICGPAAIEAAKPGWCASI